MGIYIYIYSVVLVIINYNTQGKFITKCIENFSASNTVNYNSGSVPGAVERRAVERQKIKDKQDANKSYHLLLAQKKKRKEGVSESILES